MTPASHLLDTAINNFRPEKSLETKDDFDRFYVPRPLSPLAELSQQLHVAGETAKFLVYGHRGAGKTAELNKLARDLHESHFTLVLTLEQENDLKDIHYTELLTALCRALVYEASSRTLDIDAKLLADIQHWFRQVEDIDEGKIILEAGSTQKVSAWLVSVFAQQKAEFSKRQERRYKHEQREGELLMLINRLIATVQRADAQRSGRLRPLLAIVDTLDRCRLERVKDLFQYTEALNAPAMKIIYTIPLAFSRDPQFFEVCRDFGDHDCALPTIALWDRAGQRDDVAWGLAQSILSLRFMGFPVEPAAEELLIRSSGGVLSSLFMLCYNACIAAKARHADILSLEHARLACTDVRHRFDRFLEEIDHKVLDQKLPSRKPIVDERFRHLLYLNCVLEYIGDGDKWYDMHPLVRELHQMWRDERESE